MPPSPLRARALALALLPVLGLCGLAIRPAHAAEHSFTLNGQVTRISPALATALAGERVAVGAAVRVTYTVDDSIPGTVGPESAVYAGAITAMTVRIGRFEVTHAANDGSDNLTVLNTAVGDLYRLSAAVEEDLINVPGTRNEIELTDDAGQAAADLGIGQDPDRYPMGAGKLVFDDQELDYVLSTGRDWPGAACLSGQLKAAAGLCRMLFQCAAGAAAAPLASNKDDKRARCEDRGRTRFTSQFERAVQRAGFCAYTGSADAFADGLFLEIGQDEADVVDGHQVDSRQDSRARSGLLRALGSACSGLLGAESANARRPNARAWLRKQEVTRARLERQLTRTLERADAQGVGVGAPTQPQLSDELDTLTGDVIEVLNGG